MEYNYIFLVPFLIQTVLMIGDEFFFHLKRELPLFERIGHPIDTLSVLSLYLFVYFMPYSPLNLKIFIALCVLSCLLITKDEFIHKHYCKVEEMWIHALLFINHPILLVTLGLYWPIIEKSNEGIFTYLLPLQITAIGSFLLYQIIYWNFLCKKANG